MNSETPAAPEFKQLDKKALTAALIEVDSLPAKWSEGSSAGTSKATYCGTKPSKADIAVNRAFDKGGGLSTEVANTGLGQYASEDIAAKKFETFRAGMKTCKSEKVDGERLKYVIVNTEDVGYPSFGWKVEAESYTVLVNMAQIGPTLVQTGTGGIVNVDADLPGDLLKKQIDEYVAAAQ